MLFQITVKSITGRKLTGTTQSVVVNSENCYDIEAYGSDTRMKYVVNPNDRRDKALLITFDETIASILAAANTAWGDILVKLPVETEVGGTTTDRYIPVKSITWVEKVAAESDHVYVTYNTGGYKSTTVMVPFSLNDLKYVASTGTSSS